MKRLRFHEIFYVFSNFFREYQKDKSFIIQVASYCDHCKGHTSLSSDTRLPTSVVGIKGNLQFGVGINDNLRQQSPLLSLMTTTHAPPKSMLPSESLSPFGINGKGWPQLHLIMTSLQATPPINMHY